MLRIFVLLALGAVGLMAQFGGDFLPQGLVSYLELTDAQRRQIIQINAGFERFRGAKQDRSSQVQVEIDRETREPSPDAMALGLRYRELEAIRREIDAEQKRTVETVQALLTEPQKVKLGALQEVLRMQSTACAAVDYNLIAPPPQVFFGNIIPANRLSPGISLPTLGSGCGATVTRNIVGIPIFSLGF